MGALRLEGFAAAATIAASTDTEIFRTFVNQALVPALRRGDVVVWDNLSSHRAPDLVVALERVGASFLAWPPDAPALTPLEPCGSKVKQHLRSAEARTEEALGQAAAEAIASVTADDAQDGFQECGLCVH